MRGGGGGTVGTSKPRLPTLRAAPREWRWSVGALIGVTVTTPFLLWLKCWALISCQPLCVRSNYPFTGLQAHVFSGLTENWVALTERAAPGGLSFRCPAARARCPPGPPATPGPGPPQAPYTSWRLSPDCGSEPRAQGDPCPAGLYPACRLGGHASLLLTPNRPHAALLQKPAPSLAASGPSAFSLHCQVFRCVVSTCSI